MSELSPTDAEILGLAHRSATRYRHKLENELPYQFSEQHVIDLARRLAATLTVPDGYALVPVKATPAIIHALRTGGRRDYPSDELCEVRWAAAIAVATK